MSFTSDHVVVPFTTFVEHRERRSRIAAALRERDRRDALGEIRAVLGPTGADGDRGDRS